MLVITKKSEKIMIWMSRTGMTGQYIAKEIGITRQAWSQKLKSNMFTDTDNRILKQLGFTE